MTKTELLLDVIGEAKDDYLEEIDRRVERVRHRRSRRRSSLIAASVILVVGLVMQFAVVFLNEGGARSANSAAGISAGGYFYYEVSGDGFFRYSPEEGSVRLTKGNLFDRWFSRWYTFTANDYGFYYTKDNWIYRIRHGGTTGERLYRYEAKASMSYMYPAGAADIAVDAFYEGKDVGLHEELFIINGITGERKTTIIDDNSIGQEEINALRKVLKTEDPASPAYGEASDTLDSRPIVFAESVTYTVGDRTLKLILEDGNDRFDYGYRLTENGERLTEEYVEPCDVRAAGDSLIFRLGRDGDNDGLVIVRPDGTQQTVQVAVLGESKAGDDAYCITYDYRFKDNEDFWIISAVRFSDGKRFELKGFVRGEWFNDFDSDGRYLWLTYSDRIACYRIEYQNGTPAALTLIDDNICK